MTSPSLRREERERPLVAVVCAVPLLGEAVAAALEFAEVRAFAADGGDVAGLLRSLHPDAVVVDSEDAAAEAATAQGEHGWPLLHISVQEEELLLLREGKWHAVGSVEGPTPEALRNVVAGALFARGDPSQ